MRLLFLSSFYPPYELGGIEQWCAEMRAGLQSRGHEIFVLTGRYGIQSARELRGNGIVRTLHLQANNEFYRPLDFFIMRPSEEKANIIELRRAIDDFLPDVLIVWGMWNLSWNVPFFAEQWLPGKVVYYIASYWPEDKDLHRAYWQASANRLTTELVKRPIRSLALAQLKRENYPPPLKFDNSVCCSNYVNDRLIKTGKIPATSRVIYGGIDPSQFLRSKDADFSLDHKKLQLLYFGRLIYDKGVHTAINAIAVLKQKGYGECVQLTILGDGHPDYKNYLHELVAKNNLFDIVDFAGRVSREDIPRYLNNFDVFLFTSIWPEPFGRTIIEAMMAGLIVIGSDVGGSREIFAEYDHELLFPAGDAASLAERIAKLVEQPSEWKDLIAKGRKLVLEKYSMERFIDQFEEYIENNFLSVT